MTCSASTGPEVRNLGEKPKPVRSLSVASNAHESGRVTRPGTAGIHITAVMPPKKKKAPVLNKKAPFNVAAAMKVPKIRAVRKRRTNWTKRSIVDLYKCYKSGKLTMSQYQGPKKEVEDQHQPSADLAASPAAAAAPPVHDQVQGIYDTNLL